MLKVRIYSHSILGLVEKLTAHGSTNNKKSIGKIESETELCKNDDYIIAKRYKLLLKYEMEEEKVCMVKWTKNFGYNIHMNQ